MGRRKSKVKVVKKVRRKTAKIFDCPFCNHKRTVECSIDHKVKTAKVSCRVCAASYQMETNSLTEPIDVFSQWVDETEALNEKDGEDEGEYGGYAESSDKKGETGDDVDGDYGPGQEVDDDNDDYGEDY
mmetsp:Transcript_28688/g.39993  ORF Transcript_28688/g.39993 Transcript_28688/m.39993 type:complete len:129 (+) Transcript_28688:85-471(+)|eukprot:CAMPEP_0184479616 /NCGR_PEP_ID=MMETSP0113_2-20130426/1272_1 /TAXON_ID=91329 /ORGANISM="Norrisiella sphaerica, Strain BC52" /LENGTH=128 /DNA_ID=CAMNT_0026857737 /DNA_START=73 /DNA_END=459 /DNA_ORIENTATION=+